MLTFLHISDTHISAQPDYRPHWVNPMTAHPNYGIETLIKAVQNLPFTVDFILHTGDVCADPIEANYHCARELLLQLNCPVILLSGNHDSAEMLSDIVDDGECLRVMRNDVAHVNGYNLIGMDTNGIGDTHAPSLHPEMVAWVDHILKQENSAPLVVAMHHPLIETGVPWIDEDMLVKNGQTVHSILSTHIKQIRGVFHGHIHQPVTSYCDGIMYVGAPSIWYNIHGHPNLKLHDQDLMLQPGFNLVMIREERTFVRNCAFI